MAGTWSLAAEEQFYLVAPLLIWALLPRKPMRAFIFLIAIVPLLRIFLFLYHSSLFLYVLFPCRADALLVGVLCAYLMRQERVQAWFAQNTKSLYVLLFCLLAGMGYVVSLGYGYSATRVFNSFEMASFGFTIIALFYACFLLLAMIDRKGAIAGLLRNRLLRHFGVIAYGMYLSHCAVRAIAQEVVFGTRASEASVFSRDVVSLLAFLVTWFLAAMSWRFFEQPIVRWGHSFKYKMRPAAGAQQSGAINAQPLAK